MASLVASAARGALAGAAGAMALAPVDRLEKRLLGRSPSYALDEVTRRLYERVRGRAPGPFLLPRLSRALRLTYGAALGKVLALTGWRALPAAAAIASFELVAMPAVGATRPLRRWSAGETALLFAHTAVFALAFSALLRRDRR